MKRVTVVLFVLVLIILTACQPKPLAEKTLTIMTHDSFSVSANVVKTFEEANNVKLVFLKSGDAGAALNRAILTKNSPQADVFYGVDNTFLSRAIESGIFVPYKSSFQELIPAQFNLAPGNEVSPVDYGAICINFDKAWFANHNLAIPVTLQDLLKPEYSNKNSGEGLLVIENPATSSPGLGFLLATIAEFGDDGYLEYWKELKENGLEVVNDWETAYYTNFSAASGKGLQPMVVSYVTSPAAEVVYASETLTDAPTGSIMGKNTCFQQVEFVGILKGSKKTDLARKFVDFMLDVQFQQDIPLQMYMYPVNPNAEIPDVFIKYAQMPPQPAQLSPELISLNREKWIRDWTEVVLN
jgi:thiamine transport system substrate-binding protein